MKRKDCHLNSTVLHTLFPHWGKGTVVGIRVKDNLGMKISRTISVQWENWNSRCPMWMRVSELKKEQ